MATVFRAPASLALPDPCSENWMEDEKNYLEQLRALARKNCPDGEFAGEVLRFGRGDGYAQYMVWAEKPLKLIWIQIGDAWSVESALIRGLRLSDVRRMIEGDRKLAALFSRGRANEAAGKAKSRRGQLENSDA